MLVQSHDDRDTKLQKLSRKEKASGKIRGIHYVYDDVGVLVPYVGTCDALLTRKGRHGICTRQVHRDEMCVSRIGLLYGVFLSVYGNARPVAYFFVSARQSIVHGSLA